MRLSGTALAFFLLATSAHAGPPPVHTATWYSQVYNVDGIYKSMQGPSSTQRVRLAKLPSPELLWVVGYQSEIVDADKTQTLTPDFMCHNNLNITDLEDHRQHFRWPQGAKRVFTLSQGQMQVQFPEGFGIPLRSDEVLTVGTQVLNHNLENPELQIRHKTSVRFVRDSELNKPMKALYQQGVQSLVLLEGKDGHFHGTGDPATTEAAECSIGKPVGLQKNVTDPEGRVFNGHWVVEPGLEERRTRVTPYLQLASDTTVHYIAVHLHPFAVSLELRDLTADKTLFKSSARNTSDRIGLEHVDHFSSVEGIPFSQDHEYELVSIYNNTSGEPQDAMAVMFLYHHDPRPAARGLAR
jgi:hypothetical protein